MLIVNLNSRIINPAPAKLRILAVGCMSPQDTKFKFVNGGEVEILDFVTPDYVGEMDYLEGLECDPTLHGYRTVAQCALYIAGYRLARHEYEQHEDLREGMLDDEWHRRGAW